VAGFGRGGADRVHCRSVYAAVVPAHPAALALALLLERLQQAAPVRFAAATVLEPASEFGRAAMDELHQQTVSLLSFSEHAAGGLRRAGRV